MHMKNSFARTRREEEKQSVSFLTISKLVSLTDSTLEKQASFSSNSNNNHLFYMRIFFSPSKEQGRFTSLSDPLLPKYIIWIVIPCSSPLFAASALRYNFCLANPDISPYHSNGHSAPYLYCLIITPTGSEIGCLLHL